MTYRTPPRLPSFDYRGKYQYFVTCCAEERREVFTTPERVEIVRSQILRTCKDKDFAVPAGVFMTDHLHLLVEGLADTADFRRFMTLMRQRSSAAFSREFKERLWQRGYYERVLRSADEAPGVIHYIAGNPIEADLVPDGEDYPYLWTPTHPYVASDVSRTSGT